MNYLAVFSDELGNIRTVDFKSKIGLGVIESSFNGDELATKEPAVDLIREAEQAVIKTHGNKSKSRLRAVYALVVGPDQI